MAKQAAKAEEKAKKEFEKKTQELIINKKEQKMVDPSDPREYFNMRAEMIKARRSRGENPFPHKFDVTISLTEFIKKYDPMITEDGATLENEVVRVAGDLNAFGIYKYHFKIIGRVFSKREAGPKLIFYDLHGECTCVQVLANARYCF